ncbi:hydroxymethylglutaryl-CoA synthase [Candidatus Daviesbacteria bacterium RIFCSPHIGHO2_02_FULL_36_13]|uniref:Hydroxymethylglutaryl-CoA synthase n=1 Tax=Candidatus Daviesbacteria bacterium RIFCSPHIGHO2_02_FULL_36_13 TaxID=1797768 RepID=A0A1F5JV49_9BACT|nr:MAG: hydroxymethylglutaryl-CoA synthase [Candidatus Daviesbacteria bacterium RIFCSPHIGHO2_02_FULL_36_13]
MIGIVSYGTYIPKHRIKPSQIALAWGKDPTEVEKSLGVFEKAVASVDEDAITLSIEASYRALSNGNIDPLKIGGITIGSESHPYAVKPSSTVVAGILGMGTDYLAADLEFACKAGTAGIQLLSGLVSSGKTKYVLAIGSDVAQSKPSDVLEYTAGSASAAYILGKKNIIANLLDFTSFSSDTPDFWRKDTEKFPSHAGRFTGSPAYFAHVYGASTAMLKKVKMAPNDFKYAIFHMPNAKFPKEAAKKLGFTKEQIAPGFVVEYIGNPYSGSSMVGLAATLDIAKPGDKIFVCSYGSGAGSDAFVFEVTKEITTYKKSVKDTVASQIKNKEYIDYSLIAKNILTKYRL